MEKYIVKIIKWLSNRLGYQITLIKASNGKTIIDGDKKLLRYLDIIGYISNKRPIKRWGKK